MKFIYNNTLETGTDLFNLESPYLSRPNCISQTEMFEISVPFTFKTQHQPLPLTARKVLSNSEANSSRSLTCLNASSTLLIQEEISRLSARTITMQMHRVWADALKHNPGSHAFGGE
ncbi:hypothetical protein AVEN_1557-1 [Araneus ventricosus]|uniref:Uncharacterized protein n=1 Tax=Araneus ventricosus TaxID=182803 RepID=A0A4Y2DQ21_ARAVE|nr:hypothetical protein AVEN_1557-1 [Araneus ventricosus]